MMTRHYHTLSFLCFTSRPTFLLASNRAWTNYRSLWPYHHKLTLNDALLSISGRNELLQLPEVGHMLHGKCRRLYFTQLNGQSGTEGQ